MKLKTGFALAALATAIALPATAMAQNTTSGSKNGISYTATSTIVGVGSTATIAGGGSPAYLGQASNYRGTVGLLMDYGGGQRFVCSGSLTNGGRSIVTAAHCVSDGAGTPGPLSVTAFFYNGDPSDVPVYGAPHPSVTTVNVSDIFVNSNYTGEVIDQNDIAVLRLAGAAPAWANSYDLYLGGDLTGEGFNVAGYGRRSDTGGDVGSNLGTGRLRQGDNRYDFAFGDSDFGGFWTDIDPGTGEHFFGTADIEFSYVSDFDNGLAANDASCRIAAAFGLGGPKYCNLGVGFKEVGVAGGDSGGPGFINGKLASVNSYGLSFGAGFGDLVPGLNNSFGEFSGYVPIFIHKDFIISSFVPEPATWAMMIFGFGMVGGAYRRRTKGVATVAA
jgi:hypothetical protein